MQNKLSPSEIVELTRVVYNTLKLLTNGEALAGIVITAKYYDQVRDLFGPSARPYAAAGLELDLSMSHAFVVDGLLIMCGTQLE